MSGHVGSQLEDQIAKDGIVEIARYLMNCGNQPDLRSISNMLEEFGKLCYACGYAARQAIVRESDRE